MDRKDQLDLELVDSIAALPRQRLMLARLSISEWSARKVDKTATERVHSDFSAATDSGRYNKALLPKAALEEVAKVRGEARTLFYKLTLPWQDDGYRVLTTDAYFELVGEISAITSKFYGAVNRLVRDYDSWKQEAKRTRGALYNEADYPTPDEVRCKFCMDLALMPLPAGTDFRVDIDDVVRDKIQADIDKRVRTAINDAMADVRDRVVTAVGHMADKLADPKAIFRDSLVENVRELVELLPKLNASDDPRLASLPDDMSDLLKYSAQELRDNLTARAETARTARSMVDRVASWL